jgi:hypothetical protein
MLAQVLQIVEQILSVVGNVLGLTSLIVGQTKKSAQENVPFTIETSTAVTEAAVIDGTIGLAANTTRIEDIATYLIGMEARIEAAIALAQQTGSPVTLPTTPPAGYGAPSSDANAAAVWDYQFSPGSGNIMGDQLNDAAYFAMQWGPVMETPYADAKYIDLHFDFSSEAGNVPDYSDALPDPTTILPTDASIMDWLNRTVPSYVWEMLGNQTISYTNTIGGDCWIICNMRELEFRQWQAINSTLTLLQAPIWPGLANVTIGSPVAIAPGVTITTPMDGVLIELSTIPSKAGFFTFDDVSSYRNIGALAFFSDDGQEEYPQLLGFTSAVYSPKAMTQAAGVKLRAIGGLVGTITPWLRSA